MRNKKLSVAILGSRGIPNRYGGFEACAEELAVRLAKRGHSITVYTIAGHPVKADAWNGVQRVMMPDPERKLGSLSQFIYDFHCNRHSRKGNFDIILHLGYTSDSVWYRLWPEKSIHIVNMDGQEWRRTKYNRAVRAFLSYAERLATLRAQWLVADSKEIERYLREKYRMPVRYIAYGAEIPVAVSSEFLASLGLAPGRYDLIIARMEPENNIEMAIRAKMEAGKNVPLVIVGNDNAYKRNLSKKFGNLEEVRFLDAIYEEKKINSLRYYSRVYVHGHSVGGTNPSLLEAMACSCRIVAHKNPFNESVLGENAFYYSTPADLAALFKSYETGLYDGLVERNLQKIREEYNWEAVTDAYEKLFSDAIAAK
jgi:glycosyltransferase involved in cell wall biosynthesis